jgi:hypothetical protein
MPWVKVSADVLEHIEEHGFPAASRDRLTVIKSAVEQPSSSLAGQPGGTN